MTDVQDPPDKVQEYLNRCFDQGIKHPDLLTLSFIPRVFSWLKGCLPKGLVPTDIDGLFEFNGHFLLLENKFETTLLNNRVPHGQRRLFETLHACLFPRLTVVLIGVNQQAGVTCFEVLDHEGKSWPVTQADIEDLRDFAKAWTARVVNNPLDIPKIPAKL